MHVFKRPQLNIFLTNFYNWLLYSKWNLDRAEIPVRNYPKCKNNRSLTVGGQAITLNHKYSFPSGVNDSYTLSSIMCTFHNEYRDQSMHQAVKGAL